MSFLLAVSVLDPIVHALTGVLLAINGVTHSLGWSLVALAALIKIALWPLNAMQFKSMAEMQKVAPLLKALQAKYKNDPQKLQQEQMALYKEHGVNPFASCLPLVLQMPILFSLYWAIIAEQSLFKSESWLWIGSPATANIPFLAKNLAMPDYLLLGLYVISMYFSVRFSSPATDPAQAQQQKIMAFVSPVMIAFIGRGWASALILYWLTFNCFSMAQQFYMMRRLMPAGAAATPETAAVETSGGAVKNVTPPAANNGGAVSNGASTNGARKKSKGRR